VSHEPGQPAPDGALVLGYAQHQHLERSSTADGVSALTLTVDGARAVGRETVAAGMRPRYRLASLRPLFEPV
jgi:hypothetical protein